MNFVFISPQFPHTYWNFCDRLKRNGVCVLGIGDTPYDNLSSELKGALTEYYKVESLENYDEVFRACAFFSFKYGKIDWIESNNEYWLEQDARLRTDFNVTTGIRADRINNFKHKSTMKKFYADAHVPSAKCHLASTFEDALGFVAEVGYPIIIKPDIGVGASDTHKIRNEEELAAFFKEPRHVQYLMEEFIDGELFSYDAITSSTCEPLFESMTSWPPSIMDIVNDELELVYYVAGDVPEGLRQAGRATVKAFGADRRFVHLEFFRLKADKEGIGKKGDFVGLEVNMRPAGGYTPDMMNFAHSIDVYQIYADMVTSDARLFPYPDKEYCCCYVSRRDKNSYVHTHEEILAKYGSRMVMCERIPEILSGAMGNQMYTAKLENEDEANEFIAFVLGH